jgi:hypothetical protein
MTRALVKVSFALSLSLSLALAFGAGSSLAGDACTVATKGDSAPAKACAKGGRAEAKKIMKEMVKTAKGNGASFTCEGCHKDLEGFELTKNARDDFAKLSAAQKK